MKTFAVTHLVSKGIGGILMVLVRYRSNENILGVGERVEWMVSYSDFTQ